MSGLRQEMVYAETNPPGHAADPDATLGRRACLAPEEVPEAVRDAAAPAEHRVVSSRSFGLRMAFIISSASEPRDDCGDVLHLVGVGGTSFQAALVEHGDAHDDEHGSDR